ncbi:ABC transporter permease, partial [Acidobacteriota bacterium]
MFKNYLKVSFRILKRQKLYSLIKIAGLAIGLAFFILIIAYIRDEMSFDRFHRSADRIYILTSEFRGNFFGGAHHFIAGMLKDDFPEVKQTVRLDRGRLPVMHEGDIQFRHVMFADQNFFDVFTFSFKAGQTTRALDELHKIVLSAETAEAYFGDSDPLGRTLSLNMGNVYQDFVISGVLHPIPNNSSIRFECLVPFANTFQASGIDKNSTDFVTLPLNAVTFIELKDQSMAASLRSKLPPFHHKTYKKMWERVQMPLPERGFDLMKFTDYHLGKVYVNILHPQSLPAYSLILSAIAILVLILACFNYVNLSLGEAAIRFKEIGTRKVIGALQGQITRQFLTESLISSFVAFFSGLLLAFLFLPLFNTVTDKTIPRETLLSGTIILLGLCLVFVVGLLAGSYPAFVLSRLKAIHIFKGHTGVGGKRRFSRGLIALQFAISLVFIIGSIVMSRQLRFLAVKDLGYNKDNIIMVHTQSAPGNLKESQDVLQFFRNELNRYSAVMGVTGDSGTVGSQYGGIDRRFTQTGEEIEVGCFLVDFDYFKVLEIPLLTGRHFSREFSSDSREAAIVNASFVREFGLEDPVGKRFSDFVTDTNAPEFRYDPVIIGVVEDFHIHPLHTPIKPMSFDLFGFPQIMRIRNILLRTSPDDIPGTLELLHQTWTKHDPKRPLSYTFLDDALGGQYDSERNWSRIVGYAAAFAVFIACIGLFGLTAVVMAQRTKEIGIRKVLGARVSNIIVLLSKEFVLLICLANLVAWPVAFYAGRIWLQGFAYRTGLTFWIFALSAFLGALFSIIPVAYHAVRTALANPIDALRY